MMIPRFGALSVVRPVAIDMDRPAILDLAAGFGVPNTTSARTLSELLHLGGRRAGHRRPAV
jgi:hypothetical protein